MKKRIAMFVFNDGNHDQRVHKQAQALGFRGYEVRVYCFLTPGQPTNETREGYTLYREDQRGHLSRFFDDRLMGLVRRKRSPNKPEVKRQALLLPPDREPVVPCPKPSRDLPDQANSHQRAHWAYIKRINLVWAERAAAWRPHLVQAHDLDALEAAVTLGERLKVPVVYDTHELWSEQPFIDSREAVDHWDNLEGDLIKRTHAVITVNDPLARILEERYGLSKVVPLHNCQEDQELPDRPPNRKPVALYQGAYVPHRGLEQVIAAAQKTDKVQFSFRGFGSSEEELRALDRGGKIEWCPPVPGPEVVQAASTADIGLIPFLPTCLNHYYSTPNKLFEYMSAGLAIAGSHIPEIAKFTADCEMGALFDPYSPAHIASTLDEMVDSGNLVKMGQAARRAAKKRWNWDREVEKYLNLVRDLLSDRSVGKVRLEQ